MNKKTVASELIKIANDLIAKDMDAKQAIKKFEKMTGLEVQAIKADDERGRFEVMVKTPTGIEIGKVGASKDEDGWKIGSIESPRFINMVIK